MLQRSHRQALQTTPEDEGFVILKPLDGPRAYCYCNSTLLLE
jgi:hypothetical protein